MAQPPKNQVVHCLALPRWCPGSLHLRRGFMGSLSRWARRSASAASVPLEDPTAAFGYYSWFMQLTKDIRLRGCLLFPHNSPGSGLGTCIYEEVSLGLGLLTSKTRKSQWKKTNRLHHCFSNRLVRMYSLNCVLPFGAG